MYKKKLLFFNIFLINLIYRHTYMILKSITINGFKSFAKKTTIDLSHNVTGVVGPNGSGKSNIGESVRFVMGEQSMKSIRSKSLGDLVFKGGDGVSALSRASVSISLDNSGVNKKYSVQSDEGLSKFLSYDEIILSREVFTDGASVYKINSAEVRLKDVQSLLAFAGIGASTHTIISQGEADKILTASKKERKEMIEDALGLKIHHIRLKESARKLKKVDENMKIVDLVRRELTPELRHLSNQMEKISKVEEEREKLLAAYIKYFAYEDKFINNLKNKLGANEGTGIHKNFEDKINEVKNKLLELNKKELDLSNNSNNSNDNNFENKIREQKDILDTDKSKVQNETSVLMYEKNNLLSKINSEVKIIEIKKEVFINLKSDIKFRLNNIKKSLESNNTENIKSNLQELEEIILSTDAWHTGNLDKASIETELNNINLKLESFDIKLREIREKMNSLDTERSNYNNQKLIEIKKVYENKYALERELNNIENTRLSYERDLELVKSKDQDFNISLDEANRFVGHKVLGYKNETLEANYSQHENERLVERLKIRIEELGILDPTTIRNSFEEMKGRDAHLKSEIEDLTKTKTSLDSLILELENSIKTDFNKGLEKINFAFNNYFHEVFPGGRAALHVIKVKNTDSQDENNNESESEEGLEVEGVDITINLPSKKVNDINMLSGGERTLSSIALLFAMTSIIPPPFMVLDETDAALDEMNAKKYGKMLGRLSEKSRLLVITHNRETMNECDVLYGVTMGAEGYSRLLSIKFDK